MALKLRSIVMVLALAGLLVGVMGTPHFGMAAATDSHGAMGMTDCFIPGMSAVCTMSPLEHIASAQTAFSSLPQHFDSVQLLLLLAFAFAVLAILSTRRRTRPRDDAALIQQYALHRALIPVPVMQELFSAGILNPKAY